MRRLVEKYGSKLSFTAYYHPQENPCKRVNRLVKTMLTPYVKGNHKSRENHLQQVTCAYRTAYLEVIGSTSFFVNFGRLV